MNIIALTGNLCKENELKQTNNGKNVLSNILAVKNEKKDVEGNYCSDFIEIVLFEKKAEFISTYSKKGDKIEVVGKLRTDTWKDEKGEYHNKVYVVADKVNILAHTGKESENKVKSHLDITDEDLPF